MKRWIALAMLGLLALCLTACGESRNAGPNTYTTVPTVFSTADTTKATTQPSTREKTTDNGTSMENDTTSASQALSSVAENLSSKME